MLRKTILNIHIYGGLLCFSYLILLGISTLNFNHPFAFTKSPAGIQTWEQKMAIPDLPKTDGKPEPQASQIRKQNNLAILHALGSFGGPFSTTEGQWIAPDTYHAHLARPGKEYDVDVRPATGIVKITQTRSNVWALIRDLHGSSETYPESLLASSWGWYTNLCTIVVIFAGISGVYLWTARRRERRIGLLLLGAAVVVSLSMMLLVTFHG
ncbi:MAG TPA: PepSY-associated TM helix domain-containing protein [Tepidisphaeraceae bacterium]